jgi:FkbM family methyltransferase
MIDYKFIIRKHLRMDIPPPYEPEVESFVRTVRGGCFIDVGANAGMYSIRFRKNFRHVFAVEPNPKMVEVLRTRRFTHLATNVSILPFAASDRNGETSMFVDGTIGRSAGSTDTIEPSFTYRPASRPEVEILFPIGNEGREEIVVKTMRLDDYSFPPDIELMKIDVEGAEFKVIDGARETVSNARSIIVEVHDKERKSEMERIIDKWFRVRWLDPDHLLGRIRVTKGGTQK